MSNSCPLPLKKTRTSTKITIGREPRTHLRAERAHGTGTLSQRVRDMLIAGGHKPACPPRWQPARVWSSCAGTSRTRSAPQPVPCAHNRPQIVPSVFVLAGCRFTYTCVYGQPASTKGGNRYARPFGWPRVKILFFEGRRCVECAHPYSVSICDDMPLCPATY